MAGYKNLYEMNANQQTQPKPSVVQEREGEYKHNIVKTEDYPYNSIISHVEGSSWVVDYYSQMLGANQEPVPYDINQSTVNQQYHLIYNLELKLQNQDMDTDEKTNRIGVTGTAVIYSAIIPNFGDVIIADIGAGMAARMTVKRVTKKTYMKDTVYEIDYEMVEYINTKQKADHLNSFVVKESVFDRDMITYGNSPLLLKSDYDDKLTADDIVTELVDDYLKEFFSNELGSFVVPGYGMKATYDPFVVEAFREVVQSNEHPLMRRLKVLNVNEIKEAYSFSIWPVLIDPSVNKIQNIWKKAGPVAYNAFHLNPHLNSMRYSGYAQCLSPVEDLENVDYYQGWAQQPKVGSLMSLSRATSILSGTYGTAIGKQLAKELEDQNKVCCHHLVYYHEANPRANPIDSKTWLDTVNLWVRATGHWDSCRICGGCDECCPCDENAVDEHGCPKDDPYSYVLPTWYWNTKYLDDPYCSLIRRYLRGDHIELKEIFKFVRNRQSLTPKERFYQMMVMLIILKSTLRGI